MNVVPLLGKAMIAKSSSHEMSEMTVPFGDRIVESGGTSLSLCDVVAIDASVCTFGDGCEVLEIDSGSISV
jgi:hypothetical protein